MEKVIPILPYINMEEQLNFYNNIGFETISIHARNYLVLKYNNIVLHFWLNKGLLVNENAVMNYIDVENVEKLHDEFTKKLKKNNQKIPQTGIPRLSKIRLLQEDRRFTMVDPSGNTFYIGTANNGEETPFFRTFDNKEQSRKLSILYDIVYSKEDYEMAEKIIEKTEEYKETLSELDKGKLLLIKLELKKREKEIMELQELIEKNKGKKDWEKIKKKYEEIKNGE
ncbi:MAG: hypothetical protein LBS62_11600 [Clostridiales bacterium]|jgi:tetratricopeptide (TPR) repeat protein|nr:hypothetical protein [Clostridiales bacterium]